MIDQHCWRHEIECGPNDASEYLRTSAGKAAGRHRKRRKQDTGSDSFAADEP